MKLGYNAAIDTPVASWGPGLTLCRFPLWLLGKDARPYVAQNLKPAAVEPVFVLDSEAFSAGSWARGIYEHACMYWAQRYPSARFVEAGNEPDGTGPASSQMPKERYYALIAAARAAWPQATIIAGGLVAIDFGYLDGIKAAGADIAGIHPYAQTGERVGALIDACRQHTDLPLWATEWGTNVIPDPHERALWGSGMLVGLWQAGVDAAIAYRYDEDGEHFGIQGTELEAAIHDAAPNVDALPPSSIPAVAAPTILQVPSPNRWAGRPHGSPLAIVLHTMDGTLAGCDSWFRDPDNEDSSAHFGVGLDGTIHQYVQLGDSAWGNGILEPGNRWPGPAGVNPNYLSVSVETEDRGDPMTPVSDVQYAAVLALIETVILAQCPSITQLVAHDAISPASKPHCPGSRWIASGRFAQLAAATGLQMIS